jgi:signal transduction histidine kinase
VHVPELRTLSEIAFSLAASVATWGAGRAIRRLDGQEQQLGETLVELADQRGAREAAALAGERSRIAGEVHDVVAHAVSLMVLQVGAARLEVETSGGPDEVATRLRSAEAAGRDALDQLRRSLSVMRSTS